MKSNLAKTGHAALLAIFLAAVLAIGASAADPVASRRVEAALKPGAPWTAYPTRTLDDLPIAVRQQSDVCARWRARCPTCGSGTS